MHPTAGPDPPKSWISPKVQKQQDTHDSSAWRSVALSLLFPHQSSDSMELHHNGPRRAFPPLTLLCLRKLLASSSGPEFAANICPFIPHHLRRDLLQYTSVWSPLSNTRLYALCEPEGHAAGELIVVGPHSTLRSEIFQRNPVSQSMEEAADGQLQAGKDDLSWEESQYDQAMPTPLHTFVLMSTIVPVSTFLTFPVTITRMALINLQAPLPIHRLPNVCPLLIFLDLSYNQWMSKAGVGDKLLERVTWSRLNRLEVLGLRGCLINDETRLRINAGRWNDVDIIQ
jgi:hypothetical protein